VAVCFLIIPVKWTAIAAIYFTVLVSSISAIDYFVGFWKKIDHASNDRRKTAVLTRRDARCILGRLRLPAAIQPGQARDTTAPPCRRAALVRSRIFATGGSARGRARGPWAGRVRSADRRRGPIRRGDPTFRDQ